MKKIRKVVTEKHWSVSHASDGCVVEISWPFFSDCVGIDEAEEDEWEIIHSDIARDPEYARRVARLMSWLHDDLRESERTLIDDTTYTYVIGFAIAVSNRIPRRNAKSYYLDVARSMDWPELVTGDDKTCSVTLPRAPGMGSIPGWWRFWERQRGSQHTTQLVSDRNGGTADKKTYVNEEMWSQPSPSSETSHSISNDSDMTVNDHRKIDAADVTHIMIVVPAGAVEPSLPRDEVVPVIYRSLNNEMTQALRRQPKLPDRMYIVTEHWKEGGEPDSDEILGEILSVLGEPRDGTVFSVYMQFAQIDESDVKTPKHFAVLTVFKTLANKTRQVRLAMQSPLPS